MVSRYKLIDLNLNNDIRHLTTCQYMSNCPFEIKRVFWIFDTKPDVVRGAHANKNSQFLLVSINGSCKVKVDDGEKQEIFTLDNPSSALYLNTMVWKEMYDFSDNAILLVLTNTSYDKSDYLQDYQEWKKEISDGNTIS